MKRELKRYSQFIKESKISEMFDSVFYELSNNSKNRPDSELKMVENLLDRHTFWNLLMECNWFDFDNMKSSYSDMCKTDNDPDEDFQKIQSRFDSEEFTIDKIKKLFSKENNSLVGYNLVDLFKGYRTSLLVDNINNLNKNWSDNIISKIEEPFKSSSSLDSKDAIMDIYFYKLFEKLGIDKNLVALGGEGWSNFWTEKNGEEAFIRYRYGYHNTKYGKLMLEQASKTEEDLREEALRYLKEFIEYNFDSIITNTYKNKYEIRVSNLLNDRLHDIKIDEFVIVEDDRYIVDLVDMSNYFNSLSTKVSFNDKSRIEGGKLGDSYKIEPDDIASEFVKILDDIELDIVFTGNDLIIYSKFKE